MKKAALEMVEYSNSFISTYQNLVEQETHVKHKMNEAGLRFVGFFEKYQSSNLKLAEDAKTKASVSNL